MIEVKTRDGGGKNADQWAASKIKEATDQIVDKYQYLRRREPIHLSNAYYNLPLNYQGLGWFVGLIILVSDDPITVRASQAHPAIYEQDLPIHVFSWREMQQITAEIDTLPDLAYYLSDRQRFHRKGGDWQIGCEMQALALYKMANNSFPSQMANPMWANYWYLYIKTFSEHRQARFADNKFSEIYDRIVDFLPDRRKLHDGLPTGLYFAWEFSSLSRRERAGWGRKLATVTEWFRQGNGSRQFAMYNSTRGNWDVFFFSKQEPEAIHKRLVRLVELKLIKEVELSKFNQGVFGLGFQVSQTLPPRFTPVAATFNGADEVKNYSKADLEEAFRELGTESITDKQRIEEFPS